MKRLISILLVLTMLVSTFVIVVPTSSAATEAPLTFKSGYENVYMTQKKPTALPKTIEATINVPATNYDIYEGSVFAWYDPADATNTVWVDLLRKNEENKDTSGNLGLRILAKGVNTEITKVWYDVFNNYKGQKVHIAIVLGDDVKLYVNGELYTGGSFMTPAASITSDADFMNIYNQIDVSKLPTLKLGGDTRKGDPTSKWATIHADNYRNFKGGLYNACVFTDARTANEVKSDMQNLTTSADGLMFSYNTTNLSNDRVINDLSGNGYDVVKGYNPGLSFAEGLENLWSTDKKLTALPKTFEALIKSPTTSGDQYKGDIVASYKETPNSSYFIWDVQNISGKMSVRFLCGIRNATGTDISQEMIIKFMGVLDDYATGKDVHLTMTIDPSATAEDDAVILYVNGVKFTGELQWSTSNKTGDTSKNLASTKKTLAAFYSSLSAENSSNLTIGGDFRAGLYDSQWTVQHPDNFRKFMGSIYKVNMFTDVRTATEVAADVLDVSSSADGLLVSYNTSEGLTRETMSDKSGNGYDLTKGYGQGMTFSSGFDNLYAMEKDLAKLPMTYEATIRVPAVVGDQYKGDILGANNEKYAPNTSWFIWDIHEPSASESHLRFLCGKTDANGTSTSAKIVFEKALTAYIGKQVNIAMVFDKANSAIKLYINGNEWTGTIAITGSATNAADFITYYETLNPSNMEAVTVGGDFRPSVPDSPYAVQRVNNSRYFQGQIYRVSAFSDARTLVEVRADKFAVKADANLLFAHDVQASVFSETIVDQSGNGYDFKGKPIWLEEKEPITDYGYSFVVIGDTQVVARDESVTSAETYDPSYAGNFSKIYDWIINNKDEKNIQFTFHMGDITDWSNASEWKLAMENISKMDGVIPYNMVRGNHDGGPAFIQNYTAAKFAANVASGEEYGFFDGRGIEGYEENTLNAYQTLTVGSVKYLMLSLDLGPCKAVIEWANEVVAAHPYHNVIISTHSYLQGDYDSTSYPGAENYPYMDAPKDCSATQYNPGGYYNGGVNNEYGTVHWDYRLQSHKDAGENYLYQDASYMLNNLVKKHENIVMVLCGHECSDFIKNEETVGDNGNKIIQLLVDAQAVDRNLQKAGQGHAGLVAMLYFSEDGKTVTTEYYSTIRDQYYKDYGNNKTYTLDLVEYSEQVDPEDKAELEALLATANGLSENDFSATDWASLKTAIENAENALETEDVAGVYSSISALRSIISRKLDRTALNNAITAATGVENTGYETALWNAFVAARTAANNVDRNQDAIDRAASALVAAQAALRAPDYTALNSAIAEAEALDENEYSESDWALISSVLDLAKEYLTSKTQLEIDSATAALRDAMSGKTKLNYANLQTAISRVPDASEENNYSVADWTDLQTALEVAKAALTSKDQSVIDAAATELNMVTMTITKLNRKTLQNAIDEAEALDSEDFTEESWSALTTALEAAKAALTSRVQRDINSAANALKDAISALDEKPVISDTTEDTDDTDETTDETTDATDDATDATDDATDETDGATDETDDATDATDDATDETDDATDVTDDETDATEVPEDTEETEESEETEIEETEIEETEETEESDILEDVTEEEEDDDEYDDDDRKKKGCSSSVAAGSVALCSILAFGAGIVLKKKED